jgi:predicted RNase H-like HicB family nuclease
MAEPTLTVVFEPVEDGWVQARIAEVPAVITVGRDRSEARSMVEDALREYLLAVGDAKPSESTGESEKVSLVLRPAG